MAKIMVVDDAAFMRMRCSKLLMENGYEVKEAANGVEAVTRYTEYQPDGVLLDITMPEMDGIATLKKLKEIDPKAKVVMVTAMGQQSMVIEAIQAGAKDFIVKPFKPDRVVDALSKTLNG